MVRRGKFPHNARSLAARRRPNRVRNRARRKIDGSHRLDCLSLSSGVLGGIQIPNWRNIPISPATRSQRAFPRFTGEIVRNNNQPQRRDVYIMNMRVETQANKDGQSHYVNGLRLLWLRFISMAELCQLPVCLYPFRNVGFSLRGFT